MRRLTISSRPGLRVECLERPEDEDALWMLPLVFFLSPIVGSFLLLLGCCCCLDFVAALLGGNELLASTMGDALDVLGTGRDVNG